MPTIGEGTTPGCLAKSARSTAAAATGAAAAALHIRRHRCCDADVARDAYPQAGALDLDLGQAGFVKQQSEFANERAVVAGEFCGCFVVRLARHDLDPELSAVVTRRWRQAFALAPILAARPDIASR